MLRLAQPVIGIALAAAAPCGLASTSHALLIGIGDYASTDVPDLEGPPHDVEALGQALETWGFAEERVRSLIDGEATREAIMDALSAAEGALKAGDFFVFYYSGHGTSSADPKLAPPLPQTTGALVPHDFAIRPLPSILSRLITGADDISPVLRRLDARGVDVLAIFDKCYAGQSVRSGRVKGRPRSVPLPSGVYELANVQQNTAAVQGSKIWDYERVHFLYAAHQFEQAWDIDSDLLSQYPDLTVDGRPHGAFTDALLRVLRGDLPADENGDGRIAYGELRRQIRNHVFSAGFAQVPGFKPDHVEDSTKSLLNRAIPRSVEHTVSVAGPSAREFAVAVEGDGALVSRLVGALDRWRTALSDRPIVVAQATRRPDLVIDIEGEAVRFFHRSGHPLDVDHRRLDIDAIKKRIASFAWFDDLKYRALAKSTGDVRVRVEQRPDTHAGAQLNIGNTLRFQVESNQTGDLLLLNLDSEARLNVLHSSGQGMQTLLGNEPLDLAQICVTFPRGADEVLALVFHDGAKVDLSGMPRADGPLLRDFIAAVVASSENLSIDHEVYFTENGHGVPQCYGQECCRRD